METFWQDLRYGARTLARQPTFAAVAILALALGIGANTALFSVVNGVLLRPLPYPQPDQLVRVWNQILSDGLPQLWLSEPELIYYREKQQSFEGIGVFSSSGGNLTGRGEPLRVKVGNISANLFPLLGVAPAQGRNFTAQEDQPGNDQVLILAHGFWQRRLGGAADMVGRALTLNDQPFTVVGVMPPGFAFPSADVDMWSPIAIDMANPRSRGSHYLEAFARMKPGVSFPQASADISRVATQYALENFGGNSEEVIERIGWGAYLVPLHESTVGEVRVALLVLLGAVGFVLLIACANLANLLLARAATREKEVAIRATLGAGRGRIVRQLLTESVLLAVLGGAAGLVLSYLGLRALVPLSADSLPRVEEVRIDQGVLGFTLGLSLLTGILFGLAPAWHTAKTDLNESLKEGGRSSTAGGRSKLRNLLVVSEIALSLVLLIGAGLLIRSFSRLLQVDPGYRTQDVLSLRLSLPSARYPEDHQVAGFYQELLERIGKVREVKSAGAISLLPLSGTHSSGTVSVESPSAAFVPVDAHAEEFPGVEADLRSVTPGYVKAIGMTLVEGRLFESSDDSRAPRVAIVDESFAQRFWPGESPLGQRITLGGGDDAEWRTIVGVVRHAKHYGLGVEGREQAYFPHGQFPQRTMYVAIHSAGEAGNLLANVRRELAGLDPALPPYEIRTMEERLADSLAQARFNLLLLAIFAGLALVMALTGIYGVMSYAVSQRTHEFGIRMALGAHSGDILTLVLRRGLLLTLIGISVGLVAALALTSLLASLLFGVSVTDPATFLGISVLLAAVALTACCLPAWRATRVEPMVALRYE